MTIVDVVLLALVVILLVLILVYVYKIEPSRAYKVSLLAELKALVAEGIPCFEGYSPLNKMPYLENAFQSKNFRKMYPESALNIHAYGEANQCPVNDKLCNEEAVWLAQSMLLAGKSDMDDIASAIVKIHDNIDKIKKTVA